MHWRKRSRRNSLSKGWSTKCNTKSNHSNPKAPIHPNLTLTQQRIAKYKRANLSKFPYFLKPKRNREKIQVRQQKRLISFTRSVAEMHNCWSPSLSSSCLKNIPLSLNTHWTKREAHHFSTKKALLCFPRGFIFSSFFHKLLEEDIPPNNSACRRVKKVQ